MAEADGDVVLCGLVACGRLRGELRDARQGVMQAGGTALPVAPKLGEAGLRDSCPIRPERLDTGGELSQGAVDLTGGGVELARHLTQLLRGDPDAGPVHLHSLRGVPWSEACHG